MPSRSRTVGAISANLPCERRWVPGGMPGPVRKQRHRVGRVRGHRFAVLLDLHLRVAMIGGDQCRAACAASAATIRPTHPPPLDGGDRRRQDAGVADHVGIGEVDDDEGEPPALDRRHHRVGDAAALISGFRS